MLNIFLLLPVSWWLLEGLDNERGSRGNDRDGSLSILDCELDCDSETFLVDVNNNPYLRSGLLGLEP